MFRLVSRLPEGDSVFVFNYPERNSLIQYIHTCYIYDARICGFKYDREKEMLTMDMFNPAFQVQIQFVFESVTAFLSVVGGWGGDPNTIHSLSVEENSVFFRNYRVACSNLPTDSLYLLFQMFSGDELHIVAERVLVGQNHGV